MSCIRVRPNALALPLGSLQSKESSNPLALRTAGGAPHTWFFGLFVGGYNHTRGVLRPAKNRGVGRALNPTRSSTLRRFLFQGGVHKTPG
jgi:hypothetical protein